MTRAKSLVNALKSLSPTSFEHFAFDLVTAAGLRNAVWRTPGADQGRDIEGDFPHTDFSGYLAIARWYIECKRYQNSVDWPTVREKIAYAENHDADGLLLITTAHLSPQCKTEISKWNVKRHHTVVRAWDATNIEGIAVRYPLVLVKHGLAPDSRMIPPSFLSLVSQTSKIVQAAYGTADDSKEANPALDAGSALSELIAVRLHSSELGETWSHSVFDTKSDLYDWISLDGDPTALIPFDKYGLRAILAVLRHVIQRDAISIRTVEKGHIEIESEYIQTMPDSGVSLINELGIWCNIESQNFGSIFTIKARTGNG